tara:strand:- start:261 stop:1088 length:828 start_codon:yes stop_codon:yes gene_type:complete
MATATITEPTSSANGNIPFTGADPGDGGDGNTLREAITRLNARIKEIYGAQNSGGVVQTPFIDNDNIKSDAITTVKIIDDAVTADKLANSINTEITANTAKVTNATHTGDVTGSTSLTIASNAVTTAKIADDAVGADQLASNAVVTASITDDNVTFDKLEARYTASGSITTYTGAVSVDWSAATNFVMGSSLTGAIEFDFTNFKTGQVLTIHNLTGSQTITLDSDAATSEVFNKLGGNDYDGSATNALMVECISDDASAVFNYSVLTYVSDATPS